MPSAAWTARTVEWSPRTCRGPAPGARFTRDFEDMVLWLTQRTDRTTVSTLMRCSWESVTAIVNRGVADLLEGRRLQTLYRIGVDEICYRHPHHYLTIIGDHDTGTVIDVQPGRSEQSLTNFYDTQSDPDLFRSKQSAWMPPRPTPVPPELLSRRPPSATTRSTSCNGSTARWIASTPNRSPDQDAHR